MTIKNVRISRVVLALTRVLAITLVLFFLTSCLLSPFFPQEMADRNQEMLDTALDPGTDPDQLDSQTQTFIDDFSAEIAALILLQWGIALLATLVSARWAAQIAESPQQAAGYGLLVGSGAAFTNGLFCVCVTLYTIGPLGLLLFLMLIGAGVMGGRWAAATTDFSARPVGQPVSPFASATRPGTLGGRPDTFYNMGVTAALGGRRDEARQHFMRVLQMDPRHIPAWLQLANLSESPEQAWNYIQQARAINASDPAVMQAVNVIWPQVAERVAHPGPPRVQPPYSGGAMDDAQIPRSTLPEARTLTDAAPVASETPTMLDLAPVPDSAGEPEPKDALPLPPVIEPPSAAEPPTEDDPQDPPPS